MEKAREKGYKIVRIYDVWDFEQSSTDLWKGYIRKFLKITLETSKFLCNEEEYRAKPRKFGIELGELKENTGLRFIAKICLNSLWGKFGKNPKVKHSEYIDNETTKGISTNYTVSKKKQDTKLLPVTSRNIDRFSKFFHC